MEDVFQYDELPQAFRVQVLYILVEAIGRWRGGHNPRLYWPNQCWVEIHQIVAKEKGLFQLAEEGHDPYYWSHHFLLNASTMDALDLIDAAFHYVDTVIRKVHPGERSLVRQVNPDSAIDELNGRFREHRIGYEFAGGEIIRVDSKYLHAETVKPALQLLQGAGQGFSGPLEEFLKAHEHYRKANPKEAILNAGKALESTLKAICTTRRWPFDSAKDTANKLLETVFNNGLIPSYLQTHFSALRSVLESGVPTVRNKTSGHGQGATPTTVPNYLVAYVLHATAANIVLLMEAHQA
jgi:hypothetical protein